MENTTPNQTNKKIVLFSVLLVVATLFWLWTISYRDNKLMNESGELAAPAMTEETDLNEEIDSSLNSESEIELREIDNEF